MESVNLKALTKTEIFARATEEEVSSMLNCLSAKKKKYQKDEIIFHAGDIVSSIGVMLKGNAHTSLYLPASTGFFPSPNPSVK